MKKLINFLCLVLILNHVALADYMYSRIRAYQELSEQPVARYYMIHINYQLLKEQGL